VGNYNETITINGTYGVSTTVNASFSVTEVATTFTVTFNSMGGSVVNPQTVAPGGKATQPPSPTRINYNFAGWYSDASCTNVWNFASDIVTGNIALYAKWTPKNVTSTEDHFAPNLKVFPNPFTGEVRITGAEGCMLRVITADGAIAHTQKIESPDETLRLDYLPAGVYFFRFEKDGKAKTEKVVKE
jgi:uncharacterized repeat protein (TIGR02543 family)